jgi:hypothetical protein
MKKTFAFIQAFITKKEELRHAAYKDEGISDIGL